MRGKLRDLTLNRDGSQNITVTVLDTDFRSAFDELAGSPVEVEIKRYRKKRSLDANAYAWVLIDRIAAMTHKEKNEIYRETIRNIGGVSTTVCVQDKALESLIKGWGAGKLGWTTDTMPSKIDGCTTVILYYGSSVYDTEQMSRLIDLLVQEAKELGIETMTPAELDRLQKEWDKRAKPNPEREHLHQ